MDTSSFARAGAAPARRRYALIAATAIALVVLPSGLADAHEERGVGAAELTVGWEFEPALVGEPNAVSVRVERGGSGVEGLGSRLRIEVILGDASTGELDLRSVRGDPGHYRAPLIPTVPGAYSFHLTGSIDGDPVDETFTAGEGTFDEVRGASDIAFPLEAPSNAELAAAIDGLAARVDDADEPTADGTARILAGVALAVAATALATSRLAKRR